MSGVPAGYDVFLSYSRADQNAANALRDRLAQDGKLKVFIDWHALSAGRPWQPALETALAGCRAMLVLIGPKGIGSWQHREIQLGLDRQTGAEKTASPFPVIPVLLPGLESDDYPLGTFLALNTWIAFEQSVDEPGPLQRLLNAIHGQRLDGPRDFASLRPYRGLLAFREQDAGLFFGRKRFVRELCDKVRQRSAANVVTVLGRSGSGKSSVVFAGLFPELRRDRGLGQQAVWNIASLRPGGRPLQALIETFDPPDPSLGEIETLAALNRGAHLLRKGDATLAELVDHRIEKDKGSTRQLLYVDQWEELYTRAQPREPTTDEDKARAADARLFVDLVLDAAATSPCTLVLSVRSDFYPDLQTHDGLRAAVQDCQISLGPMTKAELTTAIEGPAKALDGKVEPELTRRLLRDIGLDLTNPGADHFDIGKLPLLEYALEQAWTKAKDGRLGTAHYAGLEQALEERANKVYDALSEEQKAAAKRLFVSLVTPGEGREDTRARITLSDDAALLNVAEPFIGGDARLIVSGFDATGARSAEVSHEALIRHWVLLRGWIDENRANLSARTDLAADRSAWLQRGKDPSMLIPSGLRLERARKLRDEPGDVQIKDILDYIQISIDADAAAQDATRAEREVRHQQELEAERAISQEQCRRAEAEAARSRTLRRTAVLVGIAFLIAVGMGAVGWYQFKVAKARADETTAALIWSRLAFEGPDDPRLPATVRALWDLADGTVAVRGAFLNQLALDRSHVDTLAWCPLCFRKAYGLRLEAAKITRMLGPVLAAIQQTKASDQLGRLAGAVQVLGSTPEQAQAALTLVLAAIEQTTDPYSLQPLVRTLQAFGPTPEQVQPAQELVLAAIQRTTDPFLLQALAETVHALGSTSEQAQAALTPVLAAMPRATDSAKLWNLARAVQALGPQLEAEQAQAALMSLLAAIPQASELYANEELARAMQVLGRQLGAEQALAALTPLLAAFPQTTDLYQLRALAQGVQALGPRVGAEQAQAALTPVLAAIAVTTEPFLLQALAEALQVLGPTPEQTQVALAPVLAAMSRTADGVQLWMLARAVQALKPTPEQEQAALTPVLAALAQTTDGDQLEALARAVRALGPPLGSEQVQAALSPVLAAVPKTTKPAQLEALAQAVQTLGPKLTPEQADAAIEISRNKLAAADEPRVAEAFARAIAVILHLDPAKPQPYVATIVELLKWPTTAEPGAAEALLEVLHDRVPEAPGKEAGLDATVRWVATTFPEIDLDSPPTPPASASTGAAW